MNKPEEIIKGATISDCGKFRFSLTREWELGAGTILWIMLNPSTADASIDDPTIRRCISFSRSWGAKRLEVRNLFAFRATDPKDMEKALANGGDICGPGNVGKLVDAAAEPEVKAVVAAWGAHKLAREWGTLVLREIKRPVFCLGTTKAGAPKHPLYVAADTMPKEFRV